LPEILDIAGTNQIGDIIPLANIIVNLIDFNNFFG